MIGMEVSRVKIINLAQIDKTSVDQNWILPAHFYTKTITFGTRKAVFIFIDTDLMYYGYSCNNPQCWAGLKSNFKKYNWIPTSNRMEKQFEWLELQLKQNNDADLIFVQGHHDLELCGLVQQMTRLSKLIKSFRVSAYFFGHEHFMAQKQIESTMFVLTGSGSKVMGATCSNTDWKLGNTRGFANLIIDSTGFTVQHISDKGAIVYQQRGNLRINP
jgi:hypothetical protein